MFEKVSQHHPDKVADRIGGALVDLAYTRADGGWASSNPRIAGELTLGHQTALVILETDADLTPDDVRHTVERIAGISPQHVHVSIVAQDPHLADNQRDRLRCGDNGIMRGTPLTPEQRELTALIKTLDQRFHSDAKAVLSEELRVKSEELATATLPEHNGKVLVPVLTICQSNATEADIRECISEFYAHNPQAKNSSLFTLHSSLIKVNPLGQWTGGLDTDTGAVNRKLGSDMGDGVTGGGIHFKDLSKADVSVNIVCHMLAQEQQRPVWATCSIGDEEVTFHTPGTGEAFPDNLPAAPDLTLPFADIVERARLYVLTQHGSFEHMAEYGLIS